MSSKQLKEALAAANIKIKIYRPEKVRCITTATGGTLAIPKFSEKLDAALGTKLVQFPEVFVATRDETKMAELLYEYCAEAGSLREEKVTAVEIPDSYKELVLNLDQTSKSRDLQFFMTTPDEKISHVSGPVYLKVCGIPEDEALNMARKVVPEYLPRSKKGIRIRKTINGEKMTIFNSYIPPSWMEYEGEVPDELPYLFKKLVNHVFPLQVEREYFYSWLHASLYTRAFVFLVLCGVPGSGKNRLKLVLRALHGHQNAVDGKKSTFSGTFNSQLADNTLVWLDEFSYDLEMENAMKEVQNDSISIERKGVDATRSTKIFASLAISNNKPRDNYIAFDARKFAPLVVNPNRLETSMSFEEIDELTKKVEDWSKKSFDIRFLAQIGRWVKKHGHSNRWPHLEYKGPMFYKLAHTSMSRWQKKAAQLILETRPQAGGRTIFSEKKGFLWSSMAEASQRKNADRSLQFPDFSTVKHFFDIFVDAKGQKSFKTEIIPESIMGDFWVKLINKEARIMTEVEVVKELGGEVGKGKEKAKVAEEDDGTDAL